MRHWTENIKDEFENERKEALEYLMLVLGVFPDNPMELMIIMRAIEYADISLWKEEPKSNEERINKEVFEIKAVSYFRRKLIERKRDLTDDEREKIDSIRRHELNSVHILKMKLCRI